MYIYCLPHGVKRPDIVKEIFLVVIGIEDVWKMEPNLQIGCQKSKFNIHFVDRLNVLVFC